MTGKKILLIHRYFWPQTYPYAQMLKDIAEVLALKAQVSVLTTDSGSREEKTLRSDWSINTGIEVSALSLSSEKRAGILKKMSNTLRFGIWLTYKLSTTEAEVIMVATTPPVIIAMLVRWASFFKKFKYVYHCQDVHPEAMLYGGNLHEGFVYKILRSIDRKNIDNAWRVITLSKDMVATLEKRGCRTEHVEIINNFIFSDTEQEKSFKGKLSENEVHFLFAGSLGRMQNLSLLMDSIALLKHRTDIYFTFMGDGCFYKQMKEYKNKHKLSNVSFLGQRSVHEAVNAMRNADAGIVSLSKGIINVAYPSKTMMYLGNGLPVIALVDNSSELSKLVSQYGIGIGIPPSSAELIANELEKFADGLRKKPINRGYIQKVANDLFGKQVVLDKFSEVFNEK